MQLLHSKLENRTAAGKKIWFLFGGASPEYEVSCHSAAGLLAGIDRNKYEVHSIGISRKGEWIYTEAGPDDIENGSAWLKHSANRPAVLSPDLGAHRVLLLEKNGIRSLPVDFIFPVIHGENGEDGTLQGYLEMIGIPYAGNGVYASACAIDKVLTYECMERTGIRHPRVYAVDRGQFQQDSERAADEAEKYHLGKYPLIVKPSRTGSSIGISIVQERRELSRAMETAAGFKGAVMVEEYIQGRELKVAVLGTNPPVVGAVCETAVEAGKMNDYDLKYRSDGAHQSIPARLTPAFTKQIEASALSIFQALRCSGLARVDFFLKGDELYFNEINTMPGISSNSIYPRMLQAVGINYPDMIDLLIEEALQRSDR